LKLHATEVGGVSQRVHLPEGENGSSTRLKPVVSSSLYRLCPYGEY
jgi:hypothetical protein